MKRILILLVMFSICSFYSYGQDEAKKEKKKKNTTVFIHEDVVHPSKVAQYEEACKSLVQLLKEHGDTDVKFGVAMTNDFRYLNVTPLESMADLDNNVWASLYEKVGEEKMNEMWAKYNGCYDEHRDYMLVLNHGLSYNPNNENMMQKDQLYRRWQEYQVHADKVNEAFAIAKEWKDAYTEAGTQTGYRMYTNGVGLNYGTFLVVTWAKDVDDMNAKQKAAQASLGEKLKDLQKRTMALTKSYKTYDGWMRHDLAYYPKEKTKMAKSE